MSDHRIDQLTDLGREVIGVFQRVDKLNVAYWEKKLNDGVTNVDFILQKAVKDLLMALDPGCLIISEEDVAAGCEVDDVEREVWLVDPLDGTSNFAQNIYLSGCAMARCRGRDVLESITIDFCARRVMVAAKGYGVHFSDIEGPPPVRREVNLVGISSGFVRRCITKNAELSPRFNFRIMGSQTLQMALVASGSLAANFSIEAKAWDDVAGALLVSEAGGVYQSATLRKGMTWLEAAVANVDMYSCAVGAGQSVVEFKELREVLV